MLDETVRGRLREMAVQRFLYPGRLPVLAVRRQTMNEDDYGTLGTGSITTLDTSAKHPGKKKNPIGFQAPKPKDKKQRRPC